MNKEVALSALRQLLIFGGGILVGKGLIDQAILETIIPAVVTIATAAWGLFAKSKDQAKIADK